jgi:Fe-S oxidoreductase
MSDQPNKLSEIFDLMGRQFAEKCTNCGECLRVCPIFPMTKYAEQGPEAVIRKLMDLLSGGDASEEARDMVFSCTGQCRICGSACPEGLSLQPALMSAAAKLADAGKAPPESIYQLTPGHRHSFTRVFNALLSEPSEARWIDRVPDNPEPVDVVFFAGCGLTGMPQTFLDAVEILDRMKVNFVALAGGDICCGATPILWGDLKAAQKIGQDFISAISAFSPKKAVFYCTGCHGMCLGMLPQITPIPFESSELTGFLAENIDRIPFKYPIDKAVTLHDSCSSASLGTFEATRKVLGAVPGVTLVEMDHNRANALCCGGVANYLRPDITEPIRRAPLKEAEATGADILATLCTGCQQSFVPFEPQYPFEVRSYISVVAEAVGVRHEDRFSRYMKLGDVDQVMSEARACIEASGFTLEEMARILPQYINRMCPKHGMEK